MSAFNSFSNKLALIGGGAVAVLLLVYLALLPGYFADSYKDKALGAQNKVAQKATSLNEAFQRPAFTKVDTTPANAKADLEATRKVLEESKSQLAQSKKDLTGFVPLPLMSVNGKYRDAATAARDTKTWVSKIEDYLREAGADLDYFEKLNQLDIKFENVGQSLDTLSENDSPEAVAQKFEEAANGIQAAVDEEKKLQPTASLKKSQENDIQFGEKFVSLLRQMATAIRQGDLDKEAVLSDQMDQLLTDYNNQTNQSIIDYSRDSTVNKLARELQVLDLRLEEEFKRI